MNKLSNFRTSAQPDFPDENSSGFTLLEVLIAIAILVFISFGIYQATIETYKLRDALASDGDFYSAIRLSMNIVQQDVALIYSPAISLPGAVNINAQNQQNQNGQGQQQTAQVDAQKQALLQSGDLGQSYTFWSPALDVSGLRPSHFIGSADKMSFISLSHIRIYKGAPESDFAKITYELKKDDDKDFDSQQTLALVKTESPNAFASDDIKDTFGHSYQILHGIKKLTYSYYLRDGNSWKVFKSWDSDNEDTKNIYPDIIEVKLEVVGKKRQTFTGNFKFRPEIPLNGLTSTI